MVLARVEDVVAPDARQGLVLVFVLRGFFCLFRHHPVRRGSVVNEDRHLRHLHHLLLRQLQGAGGHVGSDHGFAAVLEPAAAGSSVLEHSLLINKLGGVLDTELRILTFKLFSVAAVTLLRLREGAVPMPILLERASRTLQVRLWCLLLCHGEGLDSRGLVAVDHHL